MLVGPGLMLGRRMVRELRDGLTEEKKQRKKSLLFVLAL
jgi:hypothetical protein